MISLFEIFITFLFLFLSILYVIKKKWKKSLALFLLFICINSISETIAYNILHTTTNDYDFRVLSYNIAHGDTNIVINNDKDIFDVIQEQNADIVFLQEYKKKYYPELDSLLKNKYAYSISEIVYSRYPVFNAYRIIPPKGDRNYMALSHKLYFPEYRKDYMIPAYSVNVNVKGSILHFVNCHLLTNNYSMAYRRYRKAQTNICSFFSEVYNGICFGSKSRELQASYIKDDINQQVYPSLICGDFNDMGTAKCIDILKDNNLYDCWWKNGIGYGNTLNMVFPKLRLDHILYNPDYLDCSTIRVVESKVSDHYPIVADFKLR